MGNNSGELNLNGPQEDKEWNYKTEPVTSGKLDLQRVKRDPQWEVPSGWYRLSERHPEEGSFPFPRLGEACGIIHKVTIVVFHWLDQVQCSK